MTKVMLSLLLFGAFCLNCVVPSDLFADYYKYTDRHGVVSITNKLDSVPAKYRSTMKVVREDPKPAPGVAAQVPAAQPAEAAVPEQAANASPEPTPSPGKFAELSSRHAWFKPLVFVAGFLALFVAIIKLTSQISSPLLSRLIYLSFFFGVFVFLYKSYVAHVVESTTKIKANATAIMKNSMQREAPVLPGEVPPAQR